MKRRSLRSICASRSIRGTPETWLRRPRSANAWSKAMPLRPSCSAAETVARSLPMHETMPAPVTTTRREPIDRLMPAFPLEQAHAQVAGGVDLLAVAEHARVGDRHDQLAPDQALDVHLVPHQLRGRAHFAGELHL